MVLCTRFTQSGSRLLGAPPPEVVSQRHSLRSAAPLDVPEADVHRKIEVAASAAAKKTSDPHSFPVDQDASQAEVGWASLTGHVAAFVESNIHADRQSPRLVALEESEVNLPLRPPPHRSPPVDWEAVGVRNHARVFVGGLDPGKGPWTRLLALPCAAHHNPGGPVIVRARAWNQSP